MRLVATVLTSILLAAAAIPMGAVAGSCEVTPSSSAICDVSRPVETFINAWNTGSPELVSLFYGDLGVSLSASDPDGDRVTSAGGDSMDFLAHVRH